MPDSTLKLISNIIESICYLLSWYTSFVISKASKICNWKLLINWSLLFHLQKLRLTHWFPVFFKELSYYHPSTSMRFPTSILLIVLFKWFFTINARCIKSFLAIKLQFHCSLIFKMFKYWAFFGINLVINFLCISIPLSRDCY